ncbi:MAG: hypothetical protein WBA44_11680 [Mesorhizobium sp.]
MTIHIQSNAEHETTASDSAFQDLQDDICELLSMARILGDLLDSGLVGFEDGKTVHMPDRGRAMKVYLTYDQMEMLSFAWNNVIGRAFELKNKFHEAWDAEAGK